MADIRIKTRLAMRKIKVSENGEFCVPHGR